MNKKIAISAGAIILLSAYIIVRSCKSDSVNLKPVKAEPDYVLIQKGENKLFFELKDKNWFINEVKYPADEIMVNSFVEKVKNLRLTDTISNQPYYSRYGLDAKDEMAIVLKKDNKVIRKISVGSTSPSSRHTFVRIDDKPEVYQTDENFSAESDMNPETYRDKDICKIKKEDIVSLSISYNGKNFTFNRISGGAESGSMNNVWQCAEFEGAELDKNKMSSLISLAASLRASKFDLSETKPAREPEAKIFIKSDKNELALSVFRYDMKKNGGSEYLIISSDSKYRFIVEEWKIQKLFIDDISTYKAAAKDKN